MSTLFSHFLSKNNEIAPQEGDFTEVLTTIAVVPKKLYFYGKIPENRILLDGLEVAKSSQNSLAAGMLSGSNDDVALAKTLQKSSSNQPKRPKSVAIVGTRKPTPYGANIARKLAYECAKRGAVVVSGMAYGIDSIAHRGALEAGGVTVAVLGTPIDNISPRSHLGLAEEIVKTGGCVMSELAPGAEFYPKTSFLERNRLISGLADAVVIVEAAERSGSLNTAAHALEQGREVFAVPADITRPMSQGCNKLIKQGAIPYLGPEDVLDFLFPRPKNHQQTAQAQLLIGDNPAETAILQAIASGISEGEAILTETQLTAAELRQNLTILEIKGRVVALGMNRWELK